jgi:23S rRNA pseudouridine2604 synthase
MKTLLIWSVLIILLLTLADPPARVSKLLSMRGICSRKEAEEYITRGLVKVNGEIFKELGAKVPVDAKIEITQLAAPITILLNKPVKYVSAQPEDGKTPAIQLVCVVDLFFN